MPSVRRIRPTYPLSPAARGVATALCCALLLAQLEACSTEKPQEVRSTGTEQGASSSKGEGSDLSVPALPNGPAPLPIANSQLELLNRQMVDLEAKKTDLTAKLTQVSVAASSTTVSNLTADQAAAQHNAIADGIGVAAGVGGVALSIATGGVAGLIFAGIGAIGTIASGVNLAGDKTAADTHDATLATNGRTLAQVGDLKQNYQSQLDQINEQIAAVQKQIFAITGQISATEAAAPAPAAPAKAGAPAQPVM